MSPLLKTCVAHWNGPLVKSGALSDYDWGHRANVRVVNGRCHVTLMGSADRPPIAYQFTNGHPKGYGGFLFASAIKLRRLAPSQRKANASVDDHVRLILR